MSTQPKFNYGGQAVIEGVMIRGREHLSLAVRRQDGSITHHSERLNTLYTGVIRKLPLLRGVVLLLETLMLGMKALNKSATMAAADLQGGDEKEISGWYLGITLAVSLTLGIAVFFLGPLLIVRWLDPMIASDQVSNLIEGGIRLVFLVTYVWAIGRLGDIKRVFAYHGAEHMAVHAYEAGVPLNIDNVRKFPTPHPRCGTAFLLTGAVGVHPGLCNLPQAALGVEDYLADRLDPGRGRHQLRDNTVRGRASKRNNRAGGGSSRIAAPKADHPKPRRPTNRSSHPRG